jgi:hypothetical protein
MRSGNYETGPDCDRLVKRYNATTRNQFPGEESGGTTFADVVVDLRGQKMQYVAQMRAKSTTYPPHIASYRLRWDDSRLKGLPSPRNLPLRVNGQFWRPGVRQSRAQLQPQ